MSTVPHHGQNRRDARRPPKKDVRRNATKNKKVQCRHCKSRFVKNANLASGLCEKCLKDDQVLDVLVDTDEDDDNGGGHHEEEDNTANHSVGGTKRSNSSDDETSRHERVKRRHRDTRARVGHFFDEEAQEDRGGNSDESELEDTSDIGNIEWEDEGTVSFTTGSDVGVTETPHLMCFNCRRWTDGDDAEGHLAFGTTEEDDYLNLVMQWVPHSAVSTRVKWCLLDGDMIDDDNITLCLQCSNVCCSPNKISCGAMNAWPAFMWSVLSSTDAQTKFGLELWQLVPKAWRKWWLKSVQQLGCFQNVTMDEPAPHVREQTEDRLEVSRAIKELKALDLCRMCDRLLLVPTVKCPWGCSQWLNLATECVPFDVIYQEFLDYPKDLAGIQSDKHPPWSHGIRPNFIRSQHHILGETFDMCSPTLVFQSGKGPVILTCGDHSTASRGQCVHPPANPLGAVSSQGSDQFAPAVMKARTVASVKRKKYSDSYHIVKMKGSCDGIDSLTICNRGQHNIDDPISIRQDALAIAARADISSHVMKLARDETIPQKLADAKHEAARDFFPDSVVQRIKDTHRRTATHIPAQTALSLEATVKTSTEIEVECLNTTTGNTDIVQFKPIWPNELVHIHNCDGHGKRPLVVPIHRAPNEPGLDTRLLWLVTCSALHSPNIWKALVACVSNNWDWHGWFLHFATKQHLKHLSCRAHRHDPFKSRKSTKALMQCMFGSENTAHNPALITACFKDLSSVLVLSKAEFERDIVNPQSVNADLTEDLAEANVLLVHNDFDSDTTATEDAPLTVESYMAPMSSRLPKLTWQSVLFCSLKDPKKPLAYMRHGGLHLKWWKQEKHGVSTVVSRVTGSFARELGLCWDICVLERIHDGTAGLKKLHRQYLQLAGGQTQFKCKEHKMHLVTSARALGVQKQCWKCGGCFTAFECPMTSCSISLCKEHWQELATMDNEFHEDTVHVDCWNGPVATLETTNREASPSRDDTGPDISDLNVDELQALMEEQLLNCTQYNPEAVAELPEQAPNYSDRVTEMEDATGLTEEPPDDSENAIDAVAANTSDDFHELCVSSAVARGDSTTYEFDQDAVPGHVLMNKHARCLVRKRSKLLLTRQQRSFLERIISSGQFSVPLLYPEASLFYSIFWDGFSDGSVPGALPTAFLCGNDSLRRLNIAPLQDQIRTRLMNAELLCSSDPKYQFFCLDQLINLGCRSHDTRLVLSRGFGEKMGQGGVRMIPTEETEFYRTEQVENRPIVNKLACAIGEKMATFFYTHTLSMKDHIVMKHLKKYLDSDQAVDDVSLAIGAHPDHLSEKDKDKIRDSVVSSACSITLRAWDNICNIWMHYIINSNEKPAGDVFWSFIRKELQEKTANVYHTHSVLWCREDDGTEEGRQELVDKIRASVSGMVTHVEAVEFLHEGVVSSMEQLFDILSDLRRKLTHKHHRRCQVPVSRQSEVRAGGGDVELGNNLNRHRCKVPDNRLLSPNPANHCFLYLDVQHTELAVDLLVDLGLAVRTSAKTHLKNYDNYQHICYLDKTLQPKRHIPPTSADDGVLSPVFAKLCILNPNSDNVQYLDSYGISKYLAKYVAQVDESARVYVQAPRHHNSNDASFRVNDRQTGNTKIAAVAFAEEKKKLQEKTKHVGRLMTQPECLMLHFRIAPVQTNIDFVHVSTVPLEERPALDRRLPLNSLERQEVVEGPINSSSDLDERKVIPAILVRSNPAKFGDMPSWRQFKASDIVIAKDQLLSPFSLDSVTLFGLRPPELSFVTRQSLYHQWFVREKMRFSAEERLKNKNLFYCTVSFCEKSTSVHYDRCVWIDSTSHIVKIRKAALPKIISYISDCPLAKFGNSREQKSNVKCFFDKIQKFLQDEETIGIRSTSRKEQWKFVKRMFLCQLHKEFLPVVWHTPIKPTNTNRFLFHVLLSLGDFRNEMELLSQGTMRDSYIHAGLHDPSNPEGSIRHLCKSYVTTQLQHMPGGTKQFDRQMLASNAALKGLLLNDEIVSDGMPPYLQTHLRDKVSEEVDQKLEDVKRNLCTIIIRDLVEAGFKNMPTCDEVMSGKQSSSDVTTFDLLAVDKHPIQPEESFVEQTLARTRLHTQVEAYMAASGTCPKCPVLVGDPGAGKTTIMQLALLHCMLEGLNCFATSNMSERAQQLGVTHLADFLCIPVISHATPAQMADAALLRIYQTPWKLQLIKVLDVLGFDEFGQLPASYLSVMDIIFRRLRHSERFLGGILLVPTMDAMQLYPVKGIHPLLSSHTITCLMFLRLEHSMRAAKDAQLCRIQKITRMFPRQLINPLVKHEFVDLVSKTFTFVDDFHSDAIPRNATYVFGKKEPGRRLQSQQVQRIKSSHAHETSKCVDEQSTRESGWSPATGFTKRMLSRFSKEPAELLLHKGGIYQVTFNARGKFSQSQLAILMDLPSKNVVREHKPFKIWVAPPGSKTVPAEGVTKEELVELHWKEVSMTKAPARPKYINQHLNGRRHQYGLRMFTTSTIHAVMGQTCSALVSRVSLDDPMYQLWEREQVIVLLSRTCYGKDIIFQGDPVSTAEALYAVLQKTSQFAEYISHLLDNLVLRTSADQATLGGFPDLHHVHVPAIDNSIHPFRAKDVPIPTDTTGYVYILVSKRCPDVTYIGETKDLSTRMQAHYRGHASRQTSLENLRPWGLLAFVAGFQHDPAGCKRKAFESQWKAKRDSAPTTVSSQAVAEMAKQIMLERRGLHPTENLIYVQAGDIVNRDPQAPTANRNSQAPTGTT